MKVVMQQHACMGQWDEAGYATSIHAWGHCMKLVMQQHVRMGQLYEADDATAFTHGAML